jgi:hypothetical protein
MIVRGTLKPAAPFGQFVRALAPFLVAQWLLLAAVLLFPRMVHLLDNGKITTRGTVDTLSKEELDRRFNEMIVLPPPQDLQ